MDYVIFKKYGLQNIIWLVLIGGIVVGGFDGTSNVLAGKLFNIPVKGTHAHAYITSFNGFSDLRYTKLIPKDGGELRDLLQLSLSWRNELGPIFNVVSFEASDGELAALVSFAIAFPDGFMALVDTYDVKRYSCRMSNATSVWSVTLPNTQTHNEYR